MIEIEIRKGIEHSDFHRIHAWLTTAYWSPGVDLAKVERAARGSSLVINAFVGNDQVGYLRIISDQATFAWVCDVFVDEAHRGKGVAKKMMESALADRNHQGLRRWALATKDAHKVYASVGFKPLPVPQSWMIKHPDPVTSNDVKRTDSQ